PDRGLCLRKADSLARAGRISEALDSYCFAASLCRLRPEELPFLVETIARTLREKELGSLNGHGGGGEEDGAEGDGEDGALDLFSCRLCRCLLYEPTTVECGHTFCKRCLEDRPVEECISCRQKLNKLDGLPNGRRVNVVLSGLLDKLFGSESKGRKLWMEGEVLWKKQNLPAALEKLNAAVDLVPPTGRLLCQRVELHLEMKNLSLAVQDASSLCRLRPFWTKARYLRATALRKADRNDEAFQEFLMCVALKPDWTKVKLEAQKPSFTLFPAQNSEKGVAPESSSKLSSPSPSKPDATSGGESAKTLSGILAALPPGGLKRKHSEDGPSSASNPPSKVHKSDEMSGVAAAPAEPPRPVPLNLLDSGDLECSLCMRLFYEPVATPCGHTFCIKCLERCMDHNPNCPLCKENLSEYLATRGYSKTLLMEEVLQRFLAEELAERKKIHEEEMKELSNLNQEVPIFVCTTAFPTIPCPLHVFEPRYRLMIRRSMETGTKQFGMCIADDLKGFADYGCMLQVRDVKFFPDGRSVVDTIGVSRFKVLSHGQRDGYHTAKIEYLEDKRVEAEELAELLKLHDSVYEQASSWFTSLKDNMKSQILSHFGHLPSKDPDPQASPSGPAWCWWLLAVLPLENRAQLTILAMTSLKDRLVAIRRVLIFVTRKRP
uniref:LON peptidase N-terminal domain and ring finger 2 n=1 Tax=Tetraodon nigroviridis TaxID=99883 RepID=H3DE22_TETNG